MAKSLYITGTEHSSGKSVVTLGVMQFLQSKVRRIAFFRPIIDSEDEAKRIQTQRRAEYDSLESQLKNLEQQIKA